MTSIKAGRGKIPPYNLFFILFVSRIVVALTYIQTVSVGRIASDVLISIVVASAGGLIAAMPAYFCIVKNKNPLDNKIISYSYSIYFIYYAAVNISRFSYFASSRLNPESSILFFVVIFVVAATYAAILGVEGIGRFSVICGVIMFIAILAVIIFNIKNVKEINYFPFIKNTTRDIWMNIAMFITNSVEGSAFVCLSRYVNGKTAKPYFFAIGLSYAFIFVLIFMCIGVLGNAAVLQSYPIFTLFQMAKSGDYSRMDMIHTAFWITAVFLKCSVLIYCASSCTKKYSHKTKCLIAGGAVILLSVLITLLLGIDMFKITKYISCFGCLIFCFGIPLLSLIFKKKKKGDDVLEKF